MSCINALIPEETAGVDEDEVVLNFINHYFVQATRYCGARLGRKGRKQERPGRGGGVSFGSGNTLPSWSHIQSASARVNLHNSATATLSHSTSNMKGFQLSWGSSALSGALCQRMWPWAQHV